MAYELHLKADDIEGLAIQVGFHHKELSNILKRVNNDMIAEVEQMKQDAPQVHVEWKPSNPVAPSHDALHHTAVQPDPSTSTVDADGLPWDERIHSSNRKMTAKGVWTRRKNVDDAVYNSVVAELRGAPQAPITSAFAVDLPQPTAPWAPAPTIEQPAPVPAFLQSVVQPAPAPVQPVYAAPAPTAPTINDLFVKLQQLSKEGVFTAQYNTDLIGALIQQFQVQVNSINDIAARPDMIAAAFQYIASRGN